MTYLDTNFLVFALSSGTSEDQKLRAMLSAGEQVNISAIVWAEFACGPVSSELLSLAAKLFPHPEPFLAEDGNRAAELFNGTGRRRGSLIDCMIAAVCLRAGASIATNNVADFQRFAASGLLVVAP